MKRYSKLSISIAVLLFLALSLTSSTLAQDSLPPVEDLPGSWDSGTLAVVVLIVMLVERLLGKILPYLIKSGKEDTDSAAKAISMLCEGLKNLQRTMDNTNDKVTELHDWHNLPDPETGRMVWYGLGITRLQETMTAINTNMEAQTKLLQQLSDQIGHQSNESSQSHTALLTAIHEMLKDHKK
jgi:uncharacterized protein YukE